MPDDEHLQAVMYGPLVLAGQFEESPKKKRYGDMGPKPTDHFHAPEIAASLTKADWVQPDGKLPLTFRAVGQPQNVTLIPMYKIAAERYVVYRRARHPAGRVSADLSLRRGSGA